ncbi:MAG: phosphate/phosphite/phosphonate ABC transporter substrate-binding protein [Gammaproteobacteria bacterium]|nr:phosphate/phosphite/phosphonate ABC transporter substrate-binding protein [Gammaproteobacteria bacterium]
MNAKYCLVISRLIFITLALVSQLFMNMTALADDSPIELRLGYIPDQSGPFLESGYRLLTDYLSEKTGYGFKLIKAATYEDLMLRVGRQEIDFANFGAYTYLQVQIEYGMLPLTMRVKDREFTSVFIAHSGINTDKLLDTTGLRLAFGSKLSTSGHLMPRYFMSEMNIEPESFFRGIQYTNNHEETARLVEKGDADLGVLNSEIFTRMVRNGEIDSTRIRVLWVTPPYVDYVWAIHPATPQKVKDKLMYAFLALDPAIPQQRELLERLNAKQYLPALTDDFAIIRRVARNLDLLETSP